MQDAQHADQGDESLVGLSLSSFRGLGSRVHNLKHLQYDLTWVAEPRNGLKTGLTSRHRDEHLNQVPANLLCELGIFKNLLQFGEDLGRKRLFDNGEVSKGVGCGGLRLVETLNNFVGGRHDDGERRTHKVKQKNKRADHRRKTPRADASGC